MAARRSGQREARRPSGDRMAAGVGVILTLGLFLLPGLAVGQLDPEQGEILLPPTQSVAEQKSALPAAGRDGGRMVSLLRQNGRVEELTMSEYLWGVVAAEMPAAFEPEALKAQAAAARTYTVTLQERESAKHPGAQLCDDSACCQAYTDKQAAETRWGIQMGIYSEKITNAITETDGQGVLYGGEPIQALFFSSAAGKTVDAVEVWGSAVDYLKSVDSPEGEEVPNYRTQVIFTPQQVQELVLAAYPGADLSGEPGSWFGPPDYAAGGSVSTISVGGVELTGPQARSLFQLRSATFSVSWNGESFLFDVTGYGHGVGMSQYGANAMAKEGKGWKEILSWYYTGTEIGSLW